MTRRRRWLLGTVLVLASGAGAAWHWQSQIVGVGTRWYLARVAAREEAQGDLTERRAAVARIHRMLLLAPPSDAWVPELFDLITAVSGRVATGEIDLNWAAYVYDSYERDLARDRPTGVPRRNKDEIEASVVEYVRFYSLQKRPDVPGLGVRALAGAATGESYTVEEIEQAAREGRDVTRRDR
jgi:hypothetical protein